MTRSDLMGFPVRDLCNDDARRRAIAPALKPLIPGERKAGPARTLRITSDQDNADTAGQRVQMFRPGFLLQVTSEKDLDKTNISVEFPFRLVDPVDGLFNDNDKGVVTRSDIAPAVLQQVADVEVPEGLIHRSTHMGDTMLGVFERDPYETAQLGGTDGPTRDIL
ncbi:MAG: hypothetical protein AAF636_19485 [Pseudomonadota bacterium]